MSKSGSGWSRAPVAYAATLGSPVISIPGDRTSPPRLASIRGLVMLIIASAPSLAGLRT